MSPFVQQVITVLIAGYVVWLVVSGRTLIWGERDHPNFFALNTRWVFRDDETALYWGSVALHVVLLLAMAYIAFLR